MKMNLDSLKYVVTYINLDGDSGREFFEFFDDAVKRFEICKELYDSVRLTMLQTITTEVRIK